jgi:molybdate transport system ATP-binding protein
MDGILESTPFITLDGITVRLGGSWLFDGLNWQINPDEHWVIWGPNGSGKTTLANVLMDQVAVVKGRVRRHYRDNADSYPSRPAMAMVSPHQYHSFYDREQMLDQMRHFSGRVSDRTQASALLDDESGSDASNGIAERRSQIVASFELEPLIDKPLSALSTGEFRRVLIARALITHPRMLILDEPFNNLDATSKQILIRILRQLGSADTQLVLITHRVSEVEDLFSHVLQLEHGHVVWQGSRHAFFRKMQHADSTPPKALLPETKGDYVPETREPIIRMRKVGVTFDGHRILHDIDWTMNSGENWALIGPNGAGKTTLLRLITGDNLQAYANHLEIFGRPKGSGESVWDIKAHIGLVADDLQARYQRKLTGNDVVCSGFFDSVGLYRYCSSAQKRTARQWIDTLELNDLAGEPFNRMSFGQQRLLLIARAMVKSPKLMILDEPCSGLDVTHRQRVLRIVDIIGRRPSTGMLFVSHHSEEIPACVTRRLYLNEGRVVKMT